MTSIIDPKLREASFIRFYFQLKDGFELAGIKRAFLDFSRTLHLNDHPKETEDVRKENRDRAEFFLKEELTKLIEKSLTGQPQFDDEHKKLVENLQKEWGKLTIGQCQKWVNMTLKYWLLLGEDRIKNIEQNASFFHIPIDSIIQKAWFKDRKDLPWSKINKYEDYIWYQQKFRNRPENNGKTAILEEIKAFNES